MECEAGLGERVGSGRPIMERESCLVERVGPVRLWDAFLGERVGSGRLIMERERAVLFRGWVL